MSRNTPAIIGIILAIVGIGVGTFSYITIPSCLPSCSNNSGIKSTRQSFDLSETISSTTYDPIDDLNISITLNQGEWILISFNCYGHANGASARLYLKFYVNGELTNPLNLNYLQTEGQSICFEGIVKNMLPGDYTVTILATYTINTVNLYHLSLIVQTLIP